tara:strand:- start:2328 stop:2792 length:465 start_codon:yes stop_codon:yes gene_type:complete
MVNDYDSTGDEGLNAFSGFTMDSQDGQGFFKTSRLLIEPPDVIDNLYSSSILDGQQLMDCALIMAKAQTTRNRIKNQQIAKDHKENLNEGSKKKYKPLEFGNRTYSETQAIYLMMLSPSKDGTARNQLVGALTGNFIPTITNTYNKIRGKGRQR